MQRRIESQVLENRFAGKRYPLWSGYSALVVWKPRTRPNAFEGVGTGRIEWLESGRLKPACLHG